MAHAQDSKRGRPRATSRDAVVAAAVALVERSGLDALSVRRLADELDLPVSTVFAYVGHKAALVDAVAVALDERRQELVFHGEAPVIATWQEGLHLWGQQVLQALSASPALLELALSQRHFPTSGAAPALIDAMVVCAADDGTSVDELADLLSAVSAVAAALARRRQRHDRDGAEGNLTWAASRVRRDYPRAAALLDAAAARAAEDDAQQLHAVITSMLGKRP